MHLSWRSKEDVEEFLAGALLLKKEGFDLRDLASRLCKDEGKSLAQIGPNGSMTFSDFVRNVFPEVKGKKRDLRRRNLPGWKRERQRCDHLLRTAPFAERSLHEIPKEDLHDYVEEYERRATSANSSQKLRQLLRNIFEAAVSEKFILADPSSELKIPTIEPAVRPERSLQEVARVYALADPEIRLRLALGVYAGLEAFEQSKIMPEHIRIQPRELTLVGSGKKRKRRILWMHEEILRALTPFLQCQPGRPILSDESGRAQNYPYRPLRKLCALAGIEMLTPLHQRDLFKALLEDAGVDGLLIEHLMGHMPPGLTAWYKRKERYRMARIRDAIDRLPALPRVEPDSSDSGANHAGGVGSPATRVATAEGV
jgi:site-specific recombinase XerD